MLSPQQQYRRRAEALAALESIGVPVWELLRKQLPPSQFLRLSTAHRRVIRHAIPQLHFYSERTFARMKHLAASQYATSTATARINQQTVAFLTDPIRHIQIVAQQSSFISIGIDRGRQTTKIGASYEYNQKVQFTAFLVSTGKDNYEQLKQLQQGLTFSGESARCNNIWQILKYIINDERVHRPVFLHGDWNALNAIRGLKTAASKHPCCVCLVRKGELEKPAPMRQYVREGKHAQKQAPLLDVDPKRIVPTPLHDFLGLCNRIIGGVIPSIFPAAPTSFNAVKAVTVSGGTGASRVNALTGPEITRYIKSNQIEKLMINAPPTTSRNSPIHSSIPAICHHWMQQLHDFLLTAKPLEQQQQLEFSLFVDELVANWECVTNTNLTPKCHMLKHAVAFAKEFGHLGKYGEAQLEAYHALFHRIEVYNHSNEGKHIAERLRKTLADLSLIRIAPFLPSNFTFLSTQ